MKEDKSHVTLPFIIGHTLEIYLFCFSQDRAKMRKLLTDFDCEDKPFKVGYFLRHPMGKQN